MSSPETSAPAASRPVLASLAVHLAASPLAAVVGTNACPLLDQGGLLALTGIMALVGGVASGLYWLIRLPWLRLWRSLPGEERPDEPTVQRLLSGPLVGVAAHFATYLAGTLVGAMALNALFGHSVTNWRFWYSSMLAAGFVITLNAVVLEFLLARRLRRAPNHGWPYRWKQSLVDLRAVVLFAVATLPMGIITAFVYRYGVLSSGDLLTARSLVMWMIEIGVVFVLWAVIVVGLLNAIERGVATDVLRLIRELDKPRILVRAHLTTGGAWAEAAASLNVAADSLEQRTRLERAVRTYVGDDLAERTREADVTEARGERVPMTILFADIRGFTRRSADKTPEEIVTLLDEYFALAVDAVEGQHGHVDKFIGDGLMAWFAEDPAHGAAGDFGAPRAVAAAQDLMAKVEALNERLAERGVEPVAIGAGLNAGHVVRGNLGAGKRKQWTVIGDAVNLASRLESMTKQLGCPLVFSDTVAARLPDGAAEFLGAHEVRGQPHPVRCYAPAE